MSISSRQSELFAGEDWKVLYQAFTQINFNASDPESISQALLDYISTNYSESFNDWNENSELVAIIELVAYLAGNLAFKTDMAVRENFIDTAEARESILRLARFLSYNPSRNQCAAGIVKLMAVSTSGNVYDSNGIDLSGLKITWDNPDDPDWFERFCAVLNDAFVGTNPYGVPLKQGMVQSIATQLYRLNAAASANTFGFSCTVAGSSTDFEICNGDFDDGGVLRERTPNPTNAFNLYNLNDGNGNSSPRTGFFMLFKQGTTRATTFNIPTPQENTLLTPSNTGVNNTDVWVQTVDDAGNVLTTWTPVPIMLDENITYNSLPADQRNIYTVVSRDNDQISIRFSDGRYGNAPVGNLQVIYRVSNGQSYTIRPQEINLISLPLTYVNNSGTQCTITLTFSLQEAVGNATPAETIAQIRQRASQVYATQNRMTSGEDYNTFPLQTNLAAKIKAVNRVYSGQSRYIDLNDPTGTYQDLCIVADDGVFFKEAANSYTEVPLSLNRTEPEMVTLYIQPMLSSKEASNIALDVLMSAVLLPFGAVGQISATPGMKWVQSQATLYTSTGYFTQSSNLIVAGSIVQFNINGVPTWIAVEAVDGDMTAKPAGYAQGPVTLSQPVPTNALVLAILPRFNATLSSDVVTQITNAISLKLSFSLWYDYVAGSGSWILSNPVSGLGDAVLIGSQLLMLSADYITGLWRFTSRGQNYVFESTSTIEWFDNGQRAIDQKTGQGSTDLINLMKFNEDLNDPLGRGLKRPFAFQIDKIWFYPNGTPEPKRTTVLLADSNGDGYPDDPDSFNRVASKNTINQYLFWNFDSFGDIQQYTSMTGFDSEALLLSTSPTSNNGGWDAANNVPTLSTGVGAEGTYYTVTTAGEYALDGPNIWKLGDIVVFNGAHWVKGPIAGTSAFVVSGAISTRDQSFWTFGPTGWTQDFSGQYTFGQGRGPNVASVWIGSNGSSIPFGDQIIMQWKHYAPTDDRIDPAHQSIHDIFVLTYEYDTLVRQWIANGAVPSQMPVPPTELSLRLAFSSMETFKTFGDSIIWRPVSYKMLFGSAADPSLRMSFKVVRIPNATLSNGEIQTKVINAINAYFDISYWDFGETFYWSELAAFIHQQLVNVIGSIVPVPLDASSSFGDGFEVSCGPDQVFISVAQVKDVVIIDSNTAANLRIR